MILDGPAEFQYLLSLLMKKGNKLSETLFFFNYLKEITCVLSVCMPMQHKYLWCLKSSEKSADPLELEPGTTVSCHVGAEIQTSVL